MLHKVSGFAIFLAVYLFLSFFIPVADTAAKSDGVFLCCPAGRIFAVTFLFLGNCSDSLP